MCLHCHWGTCTTSERAQNIHRCLTRYWFFNYRTVGSISYAGLVTMTNPYRWCCPTRRWYDDQTWERIASTPERRRNSQIPFFCCFRCWWMLSLPSTCRDDEVWPTGVVLRARVHTWRTGPKYGLFGNRRDELLRTETDISFLCHLLQLVVDKYYNVLKPFKNFKV